MDFKVILPIISLLFFFIVFLFIIIKLFFASKSEYKKYGNVIFKDNDNKKSDLN